jgi:hypothetical protein
MDSHCTFYPCILIFPRVRRAWVHMGGNITILTWWSSNRLSRRARDETSVVRVEHVAAVGGQPSRWQLELLALKNPDYGWVRRVSTRGKGRELERATYLVKYT